MFDLDVIRPALISNISAICEEEGLQPSEYMLAQATPPTVQITGVAEILYDVAMQRGGDQNEVVVQAFVSLVSDIGGQAKLDRLLRSSGPSSMKEAIESDPTLGGAVDDLRVTRCTGTQVYRRDNDSNAVIGAQWFVQIETTE